MAERHYQKAWEDAVIEADVRESVIRGLKEELTEVKRQRASAWKTINRIEAVLGDATARGTAITTPLVEAILEVLGERDLARAAMPPNKEE